MIAIDTSVLIDLLGDVSRAPGIKLIVVGDGPAAPALRKALPDVQPAIALLLSLLADAGHR